MDEEILNAEITQDEARAIICKLMNECVNEAQFQVAIKKLVICATQ